MWSLNGKLKLRPSRKSMIETFRCTKELDQKIEAKAKYLGENKSQFLSVCVEEGLKRKTRYDKGKGRTLVETQETINQIIRTLTPEQENVKEQLLKLGEGMVRLWDF